MVAARRSREAAAQLDGIPWLTTADAASPRRDELAREKGFASYGAYRKASKAEREQATRRLAARDVTYRATNAVAQVAQPVRRLVDLGGGRQLLSSMNNRELYAFLVRAERNDQRVSGVATFAPPPSTVSLWRRGGIDPSYILDELRAAGSRDVKAWIEDYIDNAGDNAGGVSGGAGGGSLVGLQLTAGSAADVSEAA